MPGVFLSRLNLMVFFLGCATTATMAQTAVSLQDLAEATDALPEIIIYPAREIVTLEPGKLASFTVHEGNPLTVTVDKIKDIGIWGTIHEGRVLPV